MREPLIKLKRYTCEECGTVEHRRGGSIYFTCVPCMRKNPTKHWKLKEMLSGQREAARVVDEAIRYGQLQKASKYRCVDCQEAAVEYDHRDYRKPLAVDPVCRRCNLRRGYAIPKDGFVPEIFELGTVPYGRKSHLADLFARLGINAPELEDMPPRLGLPHWQILIAYFQPKHKEPAHA